MMPKGPPCSRGIVIADARSHKIMIILSEIAAGYMVPADASDTLPPPLKVNTVHPHMCRCAPKALVLLPTSRYDALWGSRRCTTRGGDPPDEGAFRLSPPGRNLLGAR